MNDLRDMLACFIVLALVFALVANPMPGQKMSLPCRVAYAVAMLMVVVIILCDLIGG